MKHCVGHYDDRVSSGRSLIISMENESKNLRATIEYHLLTFPKIDIKRIEKSTYPTLGLMDDGISKVELVLVQVRGKYNQIIPDEHYPMIDHFTKLLTEKLNPGEQTRIYDQLMCEYKLKNHY